MPGLVSSILHLPGHTKTHRPTLLVIDWLCRFLLSFLLGTWLWDSPLWFLLFIRTFLLSFSSGSFRDLSHCLSVFLFPFTFPFSLGSSRLGLLSFKIESGLLPYSCINLPSFLFVIFVIGGIDLGKCRLDRLVIDGSSPFLLTLPGLFFSISQRSSFPWPPPLPLPFPSLLFSVIWTVLVFFFSARDPFEMPFFYLRRIPVWSGLGCPRCTNDNW
jgi:hypothetical protein